MTREEAIEFLNSPIQCFDKGDERDLREAMDIAINALKQESKIDILDKIRAEVMDFEEELFHRPNTDYADYAAVRHCVEIIDKYMEESEDKE